MQLVLQPRIRHLGKAVIPGMQYDAAADGVVRTLHADTPRHIGALWLRPQLALIVDFFRFAAGVLLMFHYGKDLRFGPALVRGGATSPRVVGIAGPFALSSVLLQKLSEAGLAVWFGSAVVVAVCITVGFAPRVCAGVMLAMSATTYFAIWPKVLADDYWAEALAFWLLLLPSGRTLTPFTLRNWRSWHIVRVDSWVLYACVIFFGISCLRLALTAQAIPLIAQAGLVFALAFAIAPFGPWRLIGMLAAMVVSVWAIPDLGGAALIHRAVILCTVVAAAMWSPLGRHAEDAIHKAPLGAGGAIGALVVLLVGLEWIGVGLSFGPVVYSAEAALTNAALPGSLDATLVRSAARVDAGVARDGETTVKAEGLDPRDQRMQSALWTLGESAYLPDAYRSEAMKSFIRSLVVEHCRTREFAQSSSDTPGEELFLLRNGRPWRRIARFQCGQSSPMVVLIAADGRREAMGENGP